MFSRKVFFAVLFVVGLSTLLGGCVEVKDKLVPVGVGVDERAPRLDLNSTLPVEGTGSPLLTCGVQEVTTKDARLDLETFWQEPQILSLQKALEARGLKSVKAARVLASPSVKLGFVPFGLQGGIAWREQNGQRRAVALVKQVDGTLNLYPDGQQELWTEANVQEIVKQLREQDKAFQTFEKQLIAQGRHIAIGQSLGLVQVNGMKGQLYLAVEKQSIDTNTELAYYRAEVVVGLKGYQLVGSPTDVCASGEYSVTGSKDGALVNLTGVYGIGSSETKLSVMRLPKNPCIAGPGMLACLNMRLPLVMLKQFIQGDHIIMEFLFESVPQQRLHIWYKLDQAQKVAAITLESPQGDRLQGYARILQLPDERKCAAFLPPDFSNPQRLQETYQCLVDAGLRVELRLQLNEHTVTLPTTLLSKGDYATAEKLVQGIVKRANPDFKKIIEAFMTLTDDELRQCLLNQQTQRSASRMVTLGNCEVECGLAAISYGLSWASLLLGPPGSVAGAVVWIASHLTTAGGGAYGCGSCLKSRSKGSKEPPPSTQPPTPPPGGGNCFINSRSPC